VALEHWVEEWRAELKTANAEINLLNQQFHSENLRMGAELAVLQKLQQMFCRRKKSQPKLQNSILQGLWNLLMK
jgi:serine phosphatase RsbU (regulator of sigma subunit)